MGRPAWQAVFGRMLLIFLVGLFCCAVTLPMSIAALAGATGVTPLKFNGSYDWPLWAKIVVPMFTAPFALLSLFLAGYPIHALLTLHKTVHVVTDKRLLDIGPAHVESHLPTAITSLRRKLTRGGRVTLLIGLGWEKNGEDELVERTTDWIGIRDADADAAERCIRALAPQITPRASRAGD
jgi:hypothetical protein